MYDPEKRFDTAIAEPRTVSHFIQRTGTFVTIAFQYTVAGGLEASETVQTARSERPLVL